MESRRNPLWRGMAERGARPPRLLAELVGDQLFDRIERFARLRAGRGDENRGPGRGRQHHQAHDRGPADRHAVLGDMNFGIESLDRLDELGRCPRMQAALVDDEDFALEPAVSHRIPYFPERTRLAT